MMTSCLDEDWCRSGPCKNGGTCHDIGDAGYDCHCADGFEGDNCETGASSSSHVIRVLSNSVRFDMGVVCNGTFKYLSGCIY